MLKKFIFIFSFLLTTCFASDALRFKRANSEETFIIHQHVIATYSDEFITAGIFNDKEAAIEAAQKEVEQLAHVAVYIIISDDLEKKYGYIIYDSEEKPAFLEAIFIEEQFIGKGIGQKAIKLFEKDIAEKGTTEVRLFVFAHNSVALKLYEKMGYMVLETYQNPKADPIGYLMKKNLAKVQAEITLFFKESISSSLNTSVLKADSLAFFFQASEGRPAFKQGFSKNSSKVQPYFIAA